MPNRVATPSIFPLFIDPIFAPTEPLDPDLHSAYNAAASCACLTWEAYLELLHTLPALGSVPSVSLSSALALTPALAPALDKLAMLRGHREEFRVAVHRAAQPLLDARKGLGGVGPGRLPTEHLRALQVADDLHSAIWQAADPEGWGRQLSDPTARLDAQSIVRQALAVSQRLQGMVIPDANRLVWDIQKEAISAQKERNAKRQETVKPPADLDKQTKGTGERRSRGGKPPLEKSNRLKFQVYERIHREHQPGAEYIEVVKRLKDDKDFMQQVADAGLKKLDTLLVKNALTCIKAKRMPSQARNKQQTDPV